MLRKHVALMMVICMAICIAGLCPGTEALAQDSTTTAARADVAPDTIRHSTRDTTQHIKGLRDPTTAAVLGTIIPGAGLIYAGRWRHGVATYFGTVGALGLGSFLLIIDNCTLNFNSSCKPGPVWPQRTLGVGVIALGLGEWAYAAVDAVRIVNRNNARKLADRHRAIGSIEPMLIAPTAMGEPWAVGVHATW